MRVEVVDSIYSQGGTSRELSRVLDVRIMQDTAESILIWRSWVVGDFDPRFVLRDIMIDV